MKRAIRRHHYRRLVKKYQRATAWWYTARENPEQHLDWCRRLATTGKPCSCHMCCNETAETKQEYRSRWLEAEGKEEAGIRYSRPRQSFSRY